MSDSRVDLASLFGPLSDRPFDILAYGDPNVDYVFETPRIPLADEKVLGRNLGVFAGGTAANVACAASRLGVRVAAHGRVGDDANGRLLLGDFEAFGVSNAYMTTIHHATAAAMIMVDASGEKALVYAPMPPDPLNEARLEQALGKSRVLYAMPYDIDEFRRITALAHKHQTLVAIDIEAAVAPDREKLEALLACSDIVFMNEGGFRATSDEPIAPESIRPMLNQGPRLVVVTMGARGALAVTQQMSFMQSAYPADMVDATGAGDCFNGAFLSQLLQGEALHHCLSFSCAAAAICVSQIGARTAAPSRELINICLSSARSEGINDDKHS